MKTAAHRLEKCGFSFENMAFYASIECETTDTAFSVYKEKRKEKSKTLSMQ